MIELYGESLKGDVLSWNPPKHARVTWNFLGMVRFYQRFLGGIIFLTYETSTWKVGI